MYTSDRSLLGTAQTVFADPQVLQDDSEFTERADHVYIKNLIRQLFYELKDITTIVHIYQLKGFTYDNVLD